jgi:hypothetical protein
MRIELWIFFITAGLMYNAYHDNIFSKKIKDNMKYIQIGMIGVGGLFLYLFLKRHPTESHKMLHHASEMIKYMPIDKNSKDLINPFFDLTNGNSFFSQQGATQVGEKSNHITPQMKRMLRSGGGSSNKGAMKRSVSETKKKYVASSQQWVCGHCKQQLDDALKINIKIIHQLLSYQSEYISYYLLSFY